MTELETAQKRIAELEARVQELGQMARDVNSRRVVELEAELAAMRVGEPVAWQERQQTLVGWTNWYSTEHPVARGKGYGMSDVIEGIEYQWRPLYTHPQPAAQDAEPDMFWDADDRERFAYDIDEIVSEYDPGQIVSIECAQRLPSFRVLVTAGEDGNSYEYVDAAITAQGEKS